MCTSEMIAVRMLTENTGEISIFIANFGHIRGTERRQCTQGGLFRKRYNEPTNTSIQVTFNMTCSLQILQGILYHHWKVSFRNITIVIHLRLVLMHTIRLMRRRRLRRCCTLSRVTLAGIISLLQHIDRIGGLVCKFHDISRCVLMRILLPPMVTIRRTLLLIHRVVTSTIIVLAVRILLLMWLLHLLVHSRLLIHALLLPHHHWLLLAHSTVHSPITTHVLNTHWLLLLHICVLPVRIRIRGRSTMIGSTTLCVFIIAPRWSIPTTVMVRAPRASAAIVTIINFTIASTTSTSAIMTLISITTARTIAPTSIGTPRCSTLTTHVPIQNSHKITSKVTNNFSLGAGQLCNSSQRLFFRQHTYFAHYAII
mmetsp:Transcript_4952/g.6715  ORF Transcript_4952/g.6715 Transcript_4952/m.6715 type:complete len:369 (+) Transcript_4952:191-1297(+)